MKNAQTQQILSTHLGEKVRRLTPVGHGSSQNFIVITDSNRLFVELVPRTSVRANHLPKRIDFLKEHQIPVPELLYNFNAEQFTFLIFPYIQSQHIHSQNIKRRHIDQILEVVGRLASLPTTPEATAVLSPKTWPLPEMFQTKHEKIREQLTRAQNPVARRCWKVIDTYMADMPPIKPEPQPSTLIHGDLHNHNLLFDKGKLVALTDWEALAVGLPTQDLLRYIFCASSRLPAYFSPSRFERKWLKYMVAHSPYSPHEWRFGLQCFFTRRIAKMLKTPNLISLLRTQAKLNRYRKSARDTLNQDADQIAED